MPQPLRHRKPLLAATLLFSACAFEGRAQNVTPTPNVWLTVASDARLGRHLGVHADVHWRGARPETQTPAQNLLRTGLSWHLGKTALVTAGYAHAYTVPGRDDPNNPLPRLREHRLYQQFQFGDDQGAVWTRYRYRLEERWLQGLPAPGYPVGTATAREYRTRVRAQLRLLCPLNRDHKLRPGAAYAVLADEIFLNAGGGDAVPFFDQNRAAALLGVQLSASAALELGLVNVMGSRQPAYLPDGSAGTVVQAGFSFSPDLRHGAGLVGE